MTNRILSRIFPADVPACRSALVGSILIALAGCLMAQNIEGKPVGSSEVYSTGEATADEAVVRSQLASSHGTQPSAERGDAASNALRESGLLEGTSPRRGMPLVLDAGLEISAVGIRPSGSWMLVPVSIGGRDAGWFKIGTGYATPKIDKTVAERLNLPTLLPGGFLPMPAMMPDGVTAVKLVRADGLRCGGALAACGEEAEG